MKEGIRIIKDTIEAQIDRLELKNIGEVTCKDISGKSPDITLDLSNFKDITARYEILVNLYKEELRDTEALILSFRKIFTDIDSNIDYDMWPEVFLETYDKHFGITKERHGNIPDRQS